MRNLFKFFSPVDIRSCFLWACIFLQCALSVSYACTTPEPVVFADALKGAESIAVVRIESIRLKPQPYKEMTFMPNLEASVRVVETLSGQAPLVKIIDYGNHWCGGHQLNVGEYYVLLISSNLRRIELEQGSERIVSLFDEYQEPGNSTESRSTLLKYLKSSPGQNKFPPDFPIAKYLLRTRAAVVVAPK